MRREYVLGLFIGLAAAGVAAQAPQPGQPPRPSAPQQPARDTPAQQNTTSSPTGRLTGRVVAADTGRPVKRARVFISAAELPGGRGMLTDESGAFDFAALPAGRYTINASKSGYIQLSYGQRRPLQAGTPLQLLDGQQLKGVDFALPRGGVVSGRVSDENGDVMPGVMVNVSRYQYLQGDRRLVPAGQSQTDDRGTYRVWGLNPGDYYVSAVARGDGLGRGGPAAAAVAAIAAGAGRGGGRGGAGGFAFGSPAGPGGDDQDQLMYAPTYYPGVGSPAEARSVPVGVSQEVLDIDFSLQLVRTSRVSGHAENPDGSWAGNGNVNLVSESAPGGRGNFGANYGSRIGWDGQFTIANVPPGRYTLRARNNDRDAPLSAAQPLAVSSDLNDVVVRLQTGGSLSGTIAFQPGSTPVPDVTQVRIVAPSTEPDDVGGPNPNSRVNRDGTFTLDGVSVGTHLVRANGGLRGWNLKSVAVDGRDVTDTPVTIRSGQKIGNVTITFSDKVNEINGSVTDAQGSAVTEYTVLAFSTNTAAWRPQSRQIATARPDQTGMFKIRSLPAGDYYIVTVDPSEQGEWFDPAYLDQHRGGASRVTLGEGDVKTQNFSVGR